MPEVLVYHKGKKFFNMPLDERPLTIGRSSQNDLILAGEDVSRQHAKIENRAGRYWIKDVSARGTFLNGERVVDAQPLKGRDKIGIFEWQLEYCDTAPLENTDFIRRKTQLTRLASEMDADPTRVLEFGPDASEVRTLKPCLIVENAEGVRSQHQMRKKLLVIGSSPEADLVLDDAYVSKSHLSLKLTDRGFIATDLESTNGTFANGAKIREMHIVENQELILGQTKIILGFHADAAGVVKPFSEGEFCGMTGKSGAMKLLFAKILKAAPTDMTVLIRGETGVGKEMVAQALHDLSGRKEGTLVAINCGAISQTLIESELFGHEKGAFTGAAERHLGAFEQAHRGTLFLDEVGELSLEAQSKLLRVLEYGKLRRVGGLQDVQVDVRIVAATHRDLGRMVTEGKFREDLFYRLLVLPLEVAPLRERKEDITELAERFLRHAAGPKKTLSPEAIEKILAYSWPGNVRELKNAVFRALALSESSLISAQDVAFIALPSSTAISDDAFRRRRAIEGFEEAQRIREVLKLCDGDKIKAAGVLGVGRSTLFRKLKGYGIG